LPGSLVLLDKPHRRFLSRTNDERVVVVYRLFQLEARASQVVELFGSLAESRSRLRQSCRSIHRPASSNEEVAEVPPLVHVLAKLVVVHAPTSEPACGYGLVLVSFERGVMCCAYRRPHVPSRITPASHVFRKGVNPWRSEAFF